MKYIKLIAKPDTWYKPGTEVFFDDSSVKEPNVPIKRIIQEDFKKRSKEFHSGCMVGLHTPTNYHEVKVVGTDDRIDGELCFLEEFEAIETDEYLEFQDSKELEKWYEQNQSRIT